MDDGETLRTKLYSPDPAPTAGFAGIQAYPRRGGNAAVKGMLGPPGTAQPPVGEEEFVTGGVHLSQLAERLGASCLWSARGRRDFRLVETAAGQTWNHRLPEVPLWCDSVP